MRVVAQAALAIALALGSFAFVQWWDFTLPSFGAARYQAVFLSNGQAYFGRYLDRLGPYAKVENAFYIRQTPAADQDQPAESRLLRRGAELHAPLPVMLVPKTTLLFVEDLEPGSPIAAFINQALGR